MMKGKIFFLLVFLTFVFVFLFGFRDKNEIEIGGAEIKVDVADTSAERSMGLSGRKSLKEGEGMLFVFDSPSKYGFWMKDMNFAIDIVWIGEDKKVLGIEKGVLPETYPKIFYPPGEVAYALEVPATFSDTIGLEVGQSLLLSW
jgi:Uncharacterized conserved protein